MPCHLIDGSRMNQQGGYCLELGSGENSNAANELRRLYGPRSPDAALLQDVIVEIFIMCRIDGR